MVDYSKWNDLEVSDDEDDKHPQVTRFTKGSSITIGKDGWRVNDSKKETKKGLDYSKWDHLDESDGEGEENRYYEDDVWAQREEEAKAQRQTEPWVNEAKAPTPVRATLDGGVGKWKGESFFAWTQSASEVTVRFATTDKVDVFFDTASRKCIVTLGDFKASLRHDVWCRGDDRPTFTLVDSDRHLDDLKGILDWEIEDTPGTAPLPTPRCLRVTLHKRAIARDVTLWWSRLFEPGQPDISEVDLDTTDLEARRPRRTNPNALQSAWDDAHAEFLEQAKDFTPIDIVSALKQCDDPPPAPSSEENPTPSSSQEVA